MCGVFGSPRKKSYQKRCLALRLVIQPQMPLQLEKLGTIECSLSVIPYLLSGLNRYQ